MRYAALAFIFLISGFAAGLHPSLLFADCVAEPGLTASPLQPGADGRVEVLQVRAVLSSDGTAVQRKHPLDWKRRTRPQSIALSDGSLCLRIRFTDGRVKEIPFDAYVQGDTINGAKLFGGFTLEIPVPDNLQVAEVEVARKGRKALIVWTEAEVPERP